jgi:hypothetical protein
VQSAQQALGNCRWDRSARKIGDDDGELVATGARQSVGSTDARIQAGNNFLQKKVANVMAEGVIDLLETVEVNAHDGGARFGTTCAGERLREPVIEEHAIGQAGQGVVVCLMREPLAGLGRFANLLLQNGENHSQGDHISRGVPGCAQDKRVGQAVTQRADA